MKQKKIIEKYSNYSWEYYKKNKDQAHGHTKTFYLNGQKCGEGYENFDRYVGLWKWWYNDGRRDQIDTWKNGQSGIIIEFK